MPADTVLEVAGGVFRFALRLLTEVFYDWFLQGTGYLLIKLFRPSSQPSEGQCLLVGVVAWCLIALASFAVWSGFA